MSSSRWEGPRRVSGDGDSAPEVSIGPLVSKSNGALGSPSASSTASDSPTPTNSVQDASTWYSTNWQSLVSEEQAQLLGTEEESSDRQSDNEVDTEVFEMTPEQREYYRTQFISLKPSADGLLSGNIARSFFEKSRLPVIELRKIWQLADVTKDGALSLDEFNIAMHLVVCRRNHIPLPDVLPLSLLPQAQPEQTSPHRGKQWTKFVESPTNSVSSPGPKPVNFDFQKPSVEQDPKILHPVPLRVTPGPQETQPEEPVVDTLRPIQRPQPKKPAPGPGAIPPPPVPLSTEENSIVPCGKKDPPPPPPPRLHHRSHTRSSSLDLTRLGKGSALNMPPTVPPRVSPGSMSPRKQSASDGPASIDFANFAHFATEGTNHSRRQQPQHVSGGGAFQIYKKPAPEAAEPGHWSPAEIPLDVSVVRREAANLALRRHCAQLQTCLAGLQEERSNLQRFLDSLIISHTVD
uniref:RalBP1-associated Eps domain-containing protein 1 n=1 Tax=Lygus hesperus TaxID=30085 RepID=A0A0A9XAB7_LYGHE